MKASELESKHQGPSDCEARCAELGMRMGALVIVSDTLPGCVCQPKPAAPPITAPPALPAPPPPAPIPAPPAAPSPNPGEPAPVSAIAPPGASAVPAEIDPTVAAAAIMVVRGGQVAEQRRQAQQRQKNL